MGEKSAWQAVVWDLDGTLADTLRDLAEATNRALKKNGYPARPLEEYPFLVGNGARRLIQRAAGTEDAGITEKLLSDFAEIYDAECLTHTKPYEGMPETLAALRRRGIPLLVVTNKPDAQAQKIVSGLFETGLFAAVFGHREGRPTKPDPTVTLRALALVDAVPEHSLFVGDSDVDMQTAKAAGLCSAGACWGFRGEDELRRAGADFLWHRPADAMTAL